MTPEQLALVNLITTVGLDTAIAVLDGIKNAKTADEAIEALRAVQKKTWEDYKKG